MSLDLEEQEILDEVIDKQNEKHMPFVEFLETLEKGGLGHEIEHVYFDWLDRMGCKDSDRKRKEFKSQLLYTRDAGLLFPSHIRIDQGMRGRENFWSSTYIEITKSGL